jgi:excisionase family DNA binding protein
LTFRNAPTTGDLSLACSRGHLYDLVQLGKLKPRRDGRRLLFRRGDLAAYLEASAVTLAPSHSVSTLLGTFDSARA